MKTILSNIAESKLWTPQNFYRAVVKFTELIDPKTEQLACIPAPWLPFYLLKNSKNPVLYKNDSISSILKEDGTIENDFLRKSFLNFLDETSESSDFESVLYEGLINSKDAAFDDFVVWVGFSREIPENEAGNLWRKAVAEGKALFFDVSKAEFEKIEPPKSKRPYVQNPKIEFIKGDIFEGDWDHLIHCANCYHTMGGGIAARIAELFPEAVEADNQTIKNEEKIGSFSQGILEDGRSIFNLYGQKGIGNDGHPLTRNADYDAIYNGLFLIFEKLKKESPNDVVAIPYGMCCGLAGGEWTIVGAIIKAVHARMPLNVRIFDFSSEN